MHGLAGSALTAKLRVRGMKALLRQEMGELAKAAALAQAVTETAPELLQGWMALGRIERQRGRLAEAIAAYREALARDPYHPEAHQNLAVALLLAGDIPGARQGFRQAIALLRDQGRTGEATALASHAGELVRLDP